MNICSLHFIQLTEENPNLILATSITERSRKKEDAEGKIVKPTKKNRDDEEATYSPEAKESVATVEQDTSSTEIDMDATSENTNAVQTDVAPEKAVFAAQLENKILPSPFDSREHSFKPNYR